MEYVLDPEKIREYVERNVNKDNQLQTRVSNAFVNALINGKDFVKQDEAFRTQENPNFENSQFFVPILGLWNTVKEVQDTDSMAVIAYSRFRKDENLFKLLSTRFLKGCPTFFNLASGDNIKDVIDNANGVNSISFNIYLVYYSDYADVIKLMTDEDMLSGSELEVQKTKVSKLITIVKPARINVYFRDIPVMFLGTTDRTDENAAFNYGFTIATPPIGETIQDVNSFTDYGAMRFLNYEALKDDDNGKPTSFLDCYVNGETCTIMEDYCSTKIIYMDVEKLCFTDSPFIKVAEGSPFNPEETYYYLKDGIYYTSSATAFQEGVEYYTNDVKCRPIMLISRLFRKAKASGEPWVNIEFGTQLSSIIPISVITHATWYIFPWTLQEQTYYGFLKDYAYKNQTLYIERTDDNDAHIVKTETIVRDLSDLRVILKKLYLTVNAVDEMTSWGVYIDTQVIGTKLYLQRENEVTVCGTFSWRDKSRSSWFLRAKLMLNPEDGYFLDGFVTWFTDTSDLKISFGRVKISVNQTRQETFWGEWISAQVVGNALFLQREYEDEMCGSLVLPVPKPWMFHTRWMCLSEDAYIGQGSTHLTDGSDLTIGYGKLHVSANKTDEETFWGAYVSAQAINNHLFLQREFEDSFWGIITVPNPKPWFCRTKAYFLSEDAYIDEASIQVIDPLDFFVIYEKEKLFVSAATKNGIASAEVIGNTLYFYNREVSVEENKTVAYRVNNYPYVLRNEKLILSSDDASVSGTTLILNSASVDGTTLTILPLTYNETYHKAYIKKLRADTCKLCINKYISEDAYIGEASTQVIDRSDFSAIWSKSKVFVSAATKNGIASAEVIGNTLHLYNREVSVEENKIVSYRTDNYPYVLRNEKLMLSSNDASVSGTTLILNSASVDGTTLTLLPMSYNETYHKAYVKKLRVDASELGIDNVPNAVAELIDTDTYSIRIYPKGEKNYDLHRLTLHKENKLVEYNKLYINAYIDGKLNALSEVVDASTDTYKITILPKEDGSVDLHKVTLQQDEKSYEYSKLCINKYVNGELNATSEELADGSYKITILPKRLSETYHKAKLGKGYKKETWYKLYVKAPVDKVERENLIYYASYSNYTLKKSIGYLGSRYLDGSWCLYPTKLNEPRYGCDYSLEIHDGVENNKALHIREDTVSVEEISGTNYHKLVVPAFSDFKVKGYSEYYLSMSDELNSELYYAIYESAYHKDFMRWFIIPTAIEDSPYGNTRTAEVVGTCLRLEAKSLKIVDASVAGYKKLYVPTTRDSNKQQETDYDKSFVEAYDYLRFLFYVPLED